MIKSNTEKLIIKYCTNQITADELEVLNEWLNEDEKNKLVFKQYISVNFNVEQYKAVSVNELDVAWNAIESRIIEPKSKNMYWKYAVAASVLLFISLSVVFFNRESESKTIITTAPPVQIDNNIEVGTSKAVLTLSDGTDVVLEKGKKFHVSNIDTNGEELVYDVDDVAKTKIQYNYLTIPRGGEFLLKLCDGTKIWLNSESQLKYPQVFKDGMLREVELVYGEAYFDVSPSREHKGSKFLVKTQKQIVEVLGTEFNIKAYKDETHVYTTLVEGNVNINKGIASANLNPGYQSNIDLAKDEYLIKISKVDVKRVVSWKEGVFSFKNETLKEIAKVLSRWYNVDIVFKNKSLETIRFNGVSSKSQNIEEVLLNIQNTKYINAYEIEGNKIIIE